MTQLLAIPADDFQRLLAEVAQISKKLDTLHATPQPEWFTVADYAKLIGRSTRTVLRRVDDRSIQSRIVAGVRMVRFNPDA
ncbi:hypothetical protein ACJ5NV_09420 [Loktanella agnita]|uniref:hypothetical protein n=1 Tax=Loktanella agnita TaxID=287097 RepID=UPI003988513C